MNKPAGFSRVPGSPVYCAGPMFSVADKWEQERIASTLEASGYTTFLPQRDGIEVGEVMHLVNNPLLEGAIADEITHEVRRWVFALDKFQVLDRCQSLVLNLDGRTPDEGSVAEAAAAYAAGKPIVVYKTTPITILAGTDNPMVEGLSSIWDYVEDVAELPQAVALAVAQTDRRPYAYQPPPQVADLIAAGREIWAELEELRAQPTDAVVLQFLGWMRGRLSRPAHVEVVTELLVELQEGDAAGLGAR
jgi:nucleoside 2-deoxyribosyltransferase